MKLFDLNPEERRGLRRVIVWHLAYMVLVAAFFFVIYYFNFFKNHPMLRENPIFNIISPLSTLIFVAVSPWRQTWLKAITDMYKTLEGEPVFCLMAALVFLVGFYIYSGLIWVLGSLGPSLFYM